MKFRSSHQRCSVKKVALKNFANFTGKHVCWCHFLIKLQAWRPATLLKREFQHKCFPVKLTNFLRTPILKNICEQLFLEIFKALLKSSSGFQGKCFLTFFNSQKLNHGKRNQNCVLKTSPRKCSPFCNRLGKTGPKVSIIWNISFFLSHMMLLPCWYMFEAIEVVTRKQFLPDQLLCSRQRLGIVAKFCFKH